MTAHGLQESSVYCPYCGEAIEVLLNPEDVGGEYVEDCQVCCRPIVLDIVVETDGEVLIQARAENE